MTAQPEVLVVADDGGPLKGDLKMALEAPVFGDRLVVRCGANRRGKPDRCGSQVASISVCADNREVFFVRRRQPEPSLVDLLSAKKPRAVLTEYAWWLAQAPPAIETRCPGCSAALGLVPGEWPQWDRVPKDRRGVRVVTVVPR